MRFWITDDGKVYTDMQANKLPRIRNTAWPVMPRRSPSFTCKKDIERILSAKQSGDWTAVHASPLYNKHSGEYCELLVLMER